MVSGNAIIPSQVIKEPSGINECLDMDAISRGEAVNRSINATTRIVSHRKNNSLALFIRLNLMLNIPIKFPKSD